MLFLACGGPTVGLILPASSLASPLRRRRNRGFLVSATVQLNCKAATTQHLQWIITNCFTTTCSAPFLLDPAIQTNFNDLFIPSRVLPFGIYNFTFTASTIAPFKAAASASAYIIITASTITPNLVPLGTSLITHTQGQDLILGPGIFSLDPDQNTFDTTVRQPSFLTLTNLTPSPAGLAVRLLLPCLWPLQLPQPVRLTSHPRRSSHRSSQPFLLLQSIRYSFHPFFPSLSHSTSIATAIAWHYEGATLSLRSSLTIGSDGLALGQTYQFMVIMQSRRNSSIRSVGYLLVRMQNINVPTISVR